MARRVIMATILFLSLCYKVNAQEISFIGKILNKETNSTIENSSITVYEDDHIIYQTHSDNLGLFEIPSSFLKQGSGMKIHALNYDDIKIDQKSWTKNIADNQYFLGTFSLHAKPISLKEVIIKSKRRYRDTTIIDLSKQNYQRSVMIDDILSKNMGFYKDAQGQLYYNGKIVSNLLVNGGDFFGRNNMEIYQLLPALIINKIEIIETNIDSTTNTTTLKPTIKVNLQLKDKYDKGKFGNANAGAGTSDRYVINSDLYTYQNKQQLSLSLNSNNINLGNNTLQEPKVDFSANGNNLTSSNAQFTYRNLFANKIEVKLSSKGNIDNRSFLSESDRQDEGINMLSKTFNSAKSRAFDISNTNFSINYKIDTLNTISLTQTFDHSNVKESDSMNYFIRLNDMVTSSQLKREKTTYNNLYSTDINYQRKSGLKKGRIWGIDIKMNNNQYGTDEFDNVADIADQKSNQYFINGNRTAHENIYTIKSDFTEPVGESAYFDFFVSYQRDKLTYNTLTKSDTTLLDADLPFQLTNNYIKPGVKFQKTFKNVSINTSVNGLADIRTIAPSGISDKSFFNFDFDLTADYQLNSKKNISWSYAGITNYPGIQQLTSLNNTFDLVSQTTGNVNLKPEQKQSLKLYYTLRPSDSENIIFSGQYDHYTSKFGYIINSSPSSTIQNTVMANIGNSNGGELSFSILKNISNEKYINYSTSITYQETPTLINDKLILNNGVAFNQSFSTSISLIKSFLSITPILANSYSKYFYEANSITIATITYSDKLAFLIKDYQLNLYPLYNYNHSITNNNSFSMNGELRKEVFKNYGSIWLKAYDIFNSFKFYNNFIGSSYYQTVKYSNLHRYIVLGISLKFNNMK